MGPVPPEGPEPERPDGQGLQLTQSYAGDAEHETPEQVLREEDLGELIDQYIDAIHSGQKVPPAEARAGLDLAPLRYVVDRIHALDQNLAASVSEVATSDGPLIEDDEPDEPGEREPWTAATQIGKYRIVECLGSGGQAVTFKAFDPDLKRHVVLKLYHTVQTSAQRERVKREGQALARVRSPYVAQCYHVEWFEDMPYLVVEYLPGKDLAALQKTRRLPIASALELTAQVAEGLAAVAACGLLHRDLKPANILVGDDGAPRLVDFGMAAPLGGAALQSIAGTLPYMAPEVARGDTDRIDFRSDLFGLGAVLYELLTGGPPHRAQQLEKLWEEARAGDVLPARERNPKIPAAVNDLCMRCLAKDPGKRLGSAAELGRAIRRWQRRRVVRRYLLIGAAALLLLLTPLALWGVREYGRPNEISPPAAQTPIESAPRHPDGRLLRQDFPLRVELVGGKPDPSGKGYLLAEGQFFSFRIETPLDCYVEIWYVDEQGMIIKFFPNPHIPDHLLRTGMVNPIPSPGAKYAFEASESTRPEFVHVIASTSPLEAVPGKRSANSPFEVFATPFERDRWQETRGAKIVEVAKTQKVSEAIVRIAQVKPKEVKD